MKDLTDLGPYSGMAQRLPRPDKDGKDGKLWVTFRLTVEEYDVLGKMAEGACRSRGAHLRWILQQAIAEVDRASS